MDKIQPELTAILQLLIYRFSTFETDSSFGDRLQNLKYVQHGSGTSSKLPLTTRRKLFHAFLTIGLPYLWTRFNRKISYDWNWSELPNTSVKKKVWQYCNRIELLLKSLNLLNFMVFLFNGKYRNMVDRLLQMRLTYARPLMVRHVSFDYMNRELVWNGFAEIILFLFPLINFEAIKSMLVRVFKRLFAGRTSSSSSSSSGKSGTYGKSSKNGKSNSNNNSNSSNGNNSSSTLVMEKCGICGANPIQVPFVSDSCQHQFCYYCIASSVNGDPNYLCPICEEHVSSYSRMY